MKILIVVDILIQLKHKQNSFTNGIVLGLVMKFHKLVKLSHQMLDLPDSKSKHFSFIVIRNKILSVGYNLGFKTDPLAKKYKYRFNSTHAELAAIKNFPYPPSNLSKCKLVNIRIKANGELSMAKPCTNCAKLLQDLDLTKIWYTNWQGEFERD